MLEVGYDFKAKGFFGEFSRGNTQSEGDLPITIAMQALHEGKMEGSLTM